MRLGVDDPLVRSALRKLKPGGPVDALGVPWAWCPTCLVLEDDGTLHPSDTHQLLDNEVCDRCGRSLPRKNQLSLL